ncbi:tetratricopeptide repeat protein 16 isoform X2 [Dermochelys coriacea]|uniref:tetratricopeptide repeat protein 16 isoform X2 n=1 Tax=Dermochelys coriacea TaxID=27794 RepID=UPI0018E90589|nr:tetratricopeptide repeat protein 16 isoform X2 [Dermochelys coriacea]
MRTLSFNLCWSLYQTGRAGDLRNAPRVFSCLLIGRATGHRIHACRLHQSWQVRLEMKTETKGLFPTAVSKGDLQERSLRQIFRSSQTLRDLEDPSGVKTLTAIVQNKIQEHCQRGKAFFSQGEWEKAVICYSKAIYLNPQQVEFYVQKAEAFLQLCDFQSAVLNLRKAYSLSPAKEEYVERMAFILYLQGQSLFDQEVYGDALESFTRASELQPDNSVYRRRSISCLAALNRYHDCFWLVNEELDKDSKNPDLYILRAKLNEHFNQAILCYQDVQEAIALEPQHKEAQVQMQRLLKRAQKAKNQAMNKALKGNLKDALLKITFAIENSPFDARYLIFRGTLHRRLKDFNSAIDDYIKATELCEEEGAVAMEVQRQLLLTYNDFAVHCYTQGFFEEAVLLLNKALKGEKNEKGLYVNRGDCLFRLGELTFALADYQQALELSPMDFSVRRRVGMLLDELGLQEHKQGKYQQAVYRFSGAIESNPHLPHYYLHRAKSRLFLQDVMSAKEDVIITLLLDPENEAVLPVVTSLFPGQPIQDIISSKIAEVAKTILERKLQACPYSNSPAKLQWPPGALEDEPKEPGAQGEEPERALMDSESVISPCAMEHELYKQIAISRRTVSKISEVSCSRKGEKAGKIKVQKLLQLHVRDST